MRGVLFALALLQWLTIVGLYLQIHELASRFILRLTHEESCLFVGVVNEDPEFSVVTCGERVVMRSHLDFASLNDEQVCAN